MIEKSCCFTGHRVIPYNERAQIEALTERLIINLYKQGIEYFLCGCALGYDTMCAKIVLKLSKQYPIKLITVIPCLSQTDKWKSSDVEIYKEIVNSSYYSVYTGNDYSATAMHRRNRYLVDNSSVCIAYLKRNASGTKYTVNYAKEKGKTVINVAEQIV